jgi:hypothetical protein
VEGEEEGEVDEEMRWISKKHGKTSRTDKKV